MVLSAESSEAESVELPLHPVKARAAQRATAIVITANSLREMNFVMDFPFEEMRIKNRIFAYQQI